MGENRGRKSCEIVPLKEDTEIFCFLFAGLISVEVLEEQSGPTRLPFLPSLGFELSKQRYLFLFAHSLTNLSFTSVSFLTFSIAYVDKNT